MGENGRSLHGFQDVSPSGSSDAICVRTHTGNPVPYLLYDSRKKAEGMPEYSERLGNKSPLFEKEGHRLLSRLFEMDNER